MQRSVNYLDAKTSMTTLLKYTSVQTWYETQRFPR